MYTQCPDCQTTFRVSTEILQQADGRVRCGGCGNAFNALDHLSEDDDEEAKESTSDQNKKLLETLDKLAGPEVELEDTGVEWRVHEKTDEGESDEQPSEATALHSRKGDLPQPPPEGQESLDLPETEQPPPSERRYDDNTILPDDFGEEDDLDELPFLEAETPKRRASDREATRDTAEFNEAQEDLALGEPDEWEGLLEEVDEQEPEVEEVVEASVEDESEPEGEPVGDEPPGEDMPSDINTQFLVQAEEMGLDTGNYPTVEDEREEETGVAELDETDIGDPDQDEEEIELSLAEDEEPEESEAKAELESTGEFEAQIEAAEKALTGEDEDDTEISEEEIEALATLDIEEELAETGKQDGAANDELEEVDDTLAAAARSGKDVSKLFDEDSPTVETVIMEGEMFGEALDEQNRKRAQGTGIFESPGPLEDTYSLNRGKVRGGRRAGDPPSYTVIASVVMLGVLLVGQILHQSRQSLATYGAFNQTIGSIYRALGKPVTPDWDIRGWRFEATNGNVDDEKDLLTIYSRIANKSSQGLPYPLVHISLTDRWEDVIGSRILEPNDYLAGNLDPRKPVPSGETFTAVITIESPSVDATGFRLTACYRISGDRVRCADEHFKD